MEEARLTKSLVDEISPLELWAREPVLAYLVQSGKASATRRFLLCGSGNVDDAEGVTGRQYCECRWDPLCLHRRTSKALYLTPEAAKNCASWVLATFTLPATRTISAEIACELQRTAAGILSNPQIRSVVAGSIWTMELGYIDLDGAWVVPHAHMILAVPGEVSEAWEAWQFALDSVGLESPPDSFKQLPRWKDRVGAYHYINKRWRNRPVRHSRLIETMRAFEGVTLTRRTGIFRKPSARSRPIVRAVRSDRPGPMPEVWTD